MKMSREDVAPSKEPKEKKKFSRFLFDIVQEFSLDEFKTYTNFTDVMKRALDSKFDPTKQRPPLEHYIKQNFKKTTNEKLWKKGGFVSLKLTDDFYGSKTAARIFRKIYGVKNSKVVLSNVVPWSNKVDTNDSSNDSDCELFKELFSDGIDDEPPIEQIDLTKDEHLSSTNDGVSLLKRRTKYPRKGTTNMIALPSGIATYASVRKFVDQIPTEGFNDETVVSSTEPAVEILTSSSSGSSNVTVVHQMTEVMATPPSKINVISNVLLVPPTPFRNKSHLDPKEPSPPSSTINQQPEIPEDPDDPTSQPHRVVLRKPKIGPRSKVPRRDSTSENETIGNWLASAVNASQPKSTVQTPAMDPLQKVGFVKPKPKIGPKSKMIQYSSFQPSVMSTQDLMQDLMHTDSSDTTQIPAINQQEVVVSPLKDSLVHPSSVPPEELLQDLMHTDSSIVPPIKPKTLFGSAANLPLLSTQDLQHTDLQTVQPLAAHPRKSSQNEHVPEPASPVIVQASAQKHFSLPPAVTTFRNLSKSLPSIPTQGIASDETQRTSPLRSALIVKPSVFIDCAGNFVTEIPCQSCLANVQGDIPRTCTSSPVRFVAHPMSESPTHCSESSEMKNNFLQSFEAELPFVRELLAKYVAETEPSALSMKYFWFDFFKSQYEQDGSAAETQLNNSNENVDDVQMEQQSQAVINPDQLAEEPFDFANVQVKMEKIFDECCEANESYSSDVQIIEQPANEPIVILGDSTQDLLNTLVDANDSDEQLIGPFAMPQQLIAGSSNVTSTVTSSKKGFLTALPTITTKKPTYPRLTIVVESAQNNPPAILPNHDFSQQPPTPPSNENYEIEECTMTDSQHQRYELLNNENTIFLSSQLDNYAFNAGQSIDPKPLPVQNVNTRPVAQKRQSIDALSCQPYKRRRCAEAIKRELNWKIMDIKTVIFKPMLPNNIFHMELQLRNNFDTFHVQDQQSIRRMLHLSDKEWKHVAHLLTALNGYRYDCSRRPMASQKIDLTSRVMHCFMQSIPLFVRSNIQFTDFMGHCLEATEPQPLVIKNTESAIDSNILKRMEELKKNLSKEID